MNDPMNYYRVAREECREFYRNVQAPLPLHELDNIKSLNDPI
ncbi:type I pantothenate kinase, partial [Enterococcus faecium]